MENIKLPYGYLMEDYFGKSSVIITKGDGYVTVDFVRRSFETGIGFVCTDDTDTYTGRGWKQRLVGDAIKYLESV